MRKLAGARLLLTRFVLGAAPFVAVSALGACGGPNEYMVAGSGAAAGADAEIEVKRTEDGSTKFVSLHVKHLPPPERVGEGLSAYVVWFAADEQQTGKAGRLNFDPETREGRMQFTTPHEKFKVMVTAEETEAVATPSSNVVLSQEVE